MGEVGVADYYAILGIGDSLVWKHEKGEESEHDEANLEERYTREIVTLTLTTASSPADMPPPWCVLRETLPTSTSAHVGDRKVWDARSVFAADLEWQTGLQSDIQQLLEEPNKPSSQLSGLRRKMESKIKSFTSFSKIPEAKEPNKVFLGFKRRKTLENSCQGISNLQLLYVRLHPVVVPEYPSDVCVPLSDYLRLPDDFDEWAIPDVFEKIRDPAQIPASDHTTTTSKVFFAHDMVEATLGDSAAVADDPTLLLPKIMEPISSDDTFLYVPVVAVKRQRAGTEERYHEDPAIVDLAISFSDHVGSIVLPFDDDEEEEEEGTFHVLAKTNWSCHLPEKATTPGRPVVLARRNLPFGLADVAFSTRVLGRFPLRNYKSLPLPEEELPMFCYPTGCRLHRTQLCNAPLPQCYGFCVKNERGDSIYVSCVSFMEPLTSEKSDQLDKISQRHRATSPAHRYFCDHELGHKKFMTAFDEMTTFENKTICLVSRYPFWTAFRKFLAHLQLLAGSTSDLPIERWISHLLLTVPMPRPGGQAVVVPLLHNEPMVFQVPPEKDFPLLDLPMSRLFSCLNVKTVVTIVLGLLALERKVIVISTRPSLVLDICELLRALLFPFDLCAPYVPRLTEPFKSSLDFPGAIFVGIHDDALPTGLGTMVRNTYPEDSIVIDLDTGNVDCDGDRYEILTAIWDVIPQASRSQLVLELETLCRDAKIVDGQEPLDSLGDSAFFVDLPVAAEDFDVTTEERDPLDDRAVRDAFLRFFCSVLAGYESYLVVPDADFLVSGNEWFDSKGFLASVPADRAKYLGPLVSTQLFQSFIQKRTEAGDVHCILFDECLDEYHATNVPYGRLGGDVEATATDGGKEQMMFSLLVDQSATLPMSHDQSSVILPSRSTDASDAESSLSMNFSRASASIADSSARYAESVVNDSGSLIVGPSHLNLEAGRTYTYYADGNPCFPYHLNEDMFLPQEPVSCEVEVSKVEAPSLSRSGRELEDATRRRRVATSHRKTQNHRRCLWQLPKLMASHFLGSWLLCVPSLVAQPSLSDDQQSCHLLRALGAMRLLRGKQRIVPDEAAYRAMMVACGRSSSDRRVELVKLFGLVREDRIFPNAVTLGQYTKALAEGYSKRSVGGANQQDEGYGVEVSASGSKVGRYGFGSASSLRSSDFDSILNSLDSSLQVLEALGRRWRQKSSERSTGAESEAKRKRSTKQWLPVAVSSSFLPTKKGNDSCTSIKLVAMWSRTRHCQHCGYIPLEEEIQAGWDIVGGVNEVPGSVECPRCSSFIIPMLGYKEFSLKDASQIESSQPTQSPKTGGDVLLPPQLSDYVDIAQHDGASFVTYICPATLREALEHYIEEYGEQILERSRLKELDPEVYYNFSWYCARFSLPLPLPTDGDTSHHSCTFASWDRSASERGCLSAAKVLAPVFQMISSPKDNTSLSTDDLAVTEHFDDMPLLSRYNLQSFYATVWDDADLSKLLVALVEACDKRDFVPVVLCGWQRYQGDQRTRDSISSQGASSSAQNSVENTDGDIYRTILYLAKYQCTTAFHTFFPATLKPCKGCKFC